MNPPANVSRRLLNQIASFVHERCPCSLEDRSFFPTFAAIVGVEIDKVREEERKKLRRELADQRNPNEES